MTHQHFTESQAVELARTVFSFDITNAITAHELRRICNAAAEVATRELQAELEEQARIVGMGGERELALQSENAMLREALRTAEQYIDDALADHDQSYGRHPATEADRQHIERDLKEVRAVLEQSK